MPAISEKAMHLYQFIANLHIPFGLEHSLKMTHHTVLARRFLLSVSKQAIGPQAHNILLHICRRLDMSEALLAAVLAHLDDATMVHFGFEEDDHTCLYKVYL